MKLRAIHVGVGGRGVWPLKMFKGRDDFEPVALVDVKPENIAAAREIAGLGEDRCFTDMKKAMAKVEAEVVVVITPPQLHYRQCLDAAKAGKHVLVEKPFTMDLRQARKIMDAAEANGVKVCVTQNDRYGAVNATLARLVREAVYGKPAFGLMTKFSWRPRTHHSGQQKHSYLWERGIHDLDTIRSIFNSDVIGVSGRSFNPPWSPYAHGAGTVAWLDFANGATCGYLCTFAAPGKGESSFRIDCEKATLEPAGGQVRITEAGAKEPKLIPADTVPPAEAVLLDGFHAWVTRGVEPPFSGQQNLKTVALVEAVGKSSDKNKVLRL